MSNLQSLEERLESMTAKPKCNACTFSSTYLAMKKYLAKDYYPWVQAECPWYTDHGQKHIESVLHTCEHLLSATADDELTCLDVFLLLSAIIWHDVGLLAGRSNHAGNAQIFIDKVRDFCFADSAIYRIVAAIVKAHSGNEGWLSPTQSEIMQPCSHQTCTVYPKSLAALLRFADEVSESRTRIQPSLLPRVPSEQRIYWEYANSIMASIPEPNRKRLFLAIDLQRSDAMKRWPCPPDVLSHADAAGTIALIEYVVCRLEKMNNERAMCFPYLARYADVMTIDVRMRVFEGMENLVEQEFILGGGGLGDKTYPAIGIFDHFFKAYPQLKPESLEGAR